MPIQAFLDGPDRSALWRAVPNTLHGWALDGSEPPASVEIVLGRSRRIPARLGLPRPDVQVRLSDAEVAAGCGWTCQVDLRDWPDSEVSVEIVVHGRSGNPTTIAGRTYGVRSDGFAGEFDAPSDDAAPGGQLVDVQGWAVVAEGGPARVDIEVDDRVVGRARLRLPRPDIEERSPGQIFPLAGFQYSERFDGEITPTTMVTAVVVDQQGMEYRLPARAVRRQPRPVDPEDGAAARARTRHAVARMTGPHREGGAAPIGHNLLVFTHGLGLGGGELYLQELLRQITPALGSCTLVTPSDGALRAELEPLGIDVIVSGRLAPSEPAAYEGQVREISMFIRGTGCDVVLVNTLAQLPAADAAERLGIPTIWAVHESFDVESWLNLVHGSGRWHPYLLERMLRTLAGATRLVFEAHATSELFSVYAPPATRVVIPYSVDVDGISSYAEGLDVVSTRHRLGIHEDAVVLLSVGRVEERKSQIALVEAFCGVARHHPTACLALIGDTPGQYSEALHRLIVTSELSDRISVVPPTHDIWQWYLAADVFVSASDVESLPRSILESMAFGVPALAASVFGIPELIEDNHNGWLFPARDMTALTSRLDDVLALGPEERARVGDAARSTVRGIHQAEPYGAAYMRVINQIVADIDQFHVSPADRDHEDLDQALRLLSTVSRATAQLTRRPPDRDMRFSEQLDAFNRGAPHVRGGIADFVAKAADQLAPGARVADVGAGDAPYRELFKHADYVTVDWEHSIHGGALASDVLASADRLPLEDASFDAVLMTEVLEHVGDPAKVLAEAARILRPNGRIYITVPFVWMLHEMPWDYYRYTPSGLRLLLETAGFDDIATAGRGDYFTTLAQLLQLSPSWLEERPMLDKLDRRRDLASQVLADLADAIAALSPLDARVLLPLGFNASARRSVPA